MAHLKSTTKKLHYLTPGDGVDPAAWCASFGHKPRKYGDGIFCDNCETPMSEKQYATWEKANPKKTFHKRRTYNISGGVNTLGDTARDFGLQLKDQFIEHR